MAQLGDLTLENGKTLGDLTPRIGQPLNEKTLAYIKISGSVPHSLMDNLHNLPASRRLSLE